MVFIDDNNLIYKRDKHYLMSNNGTKVCQQKHVTHSDKTIWKSQCQLKNKYNTYSE